MSATQIGCRRSGSDIWVGLLVLCVAVAGAVADGFEDADNLAHVDADDSVVNMLARNRTIFKVSYENKNTSYIELRLIVDMGTYQKLGRDMDAVASYCKELINLVNVLFRPLNVVVALSDVVVWKDRNEFEYKPHGGDTLRGMKNYLNQFKHLSRTVDNVQLLINNRFNHGIVGMSYVSTMCSPAWGGYVSTHFNHTINQTAIFLAHEMGHNMGFLHRHDNCKGYVCMMSHGNDVHVHSVQWSPKNYETVATKRHDGSYHCLKNRPKQLFGSPNCGNGFVEAGEQCDCGPTILCKDPCCEATTCRLKSSPNCVQ